MEPNFDHSFTAFSRLKQIAHGSIIDVALQVKRFLEQSPQSSVFIFDDTTSAQVEIDFRGSSEDVIERLQGRFGPETNQPPGPGRPKLGVISREIGLLPRHWEWLALQPRGASATLRKLVEEAKKKNQREDQIRQSQDATYKFMFAMAGDLAHYEEALRAFYAKNRSLFITLIAPWPDDIQAHILKLSQDAFQTTSSL